MWLDDWLSGVGSPIEGVEVITETDRHARLAILGTDGVVQGFVDADRLRNGNWTASLLQVCGEE
jgi:hypothetical protein